MALSRPSIGGDHGCKTEGPRGKLGYGTSVISNHGMASVRSSVVRILISWLGWSWWYRHGALCRLVVILEKTVKMWDSSEKQEKGKIKVRVFENIIWGKRIMPPNRTGKVEWTHTTWNLELSMVGVGPAPCQTQIALQHITMTPHWEDNQKQWRVGKDLKSFSTVIKHH